MKHQKTKPPLYQFAYHRKGWLDGISKAVMQENWGKNNYVLEQFLQNRFEIANSEGKIYKDSAFAVWAPGLFTETQDPVWMLYERNPNEQQEWLFAKIVTDPNELPMCDAGPCELLPSWFLEPFDSKAAIHITPEKMEKIVAKNSERLADIFGTSITNNPYLFYLAVKQAIEIQTKIPADILPQWWQGKYAYFIPLALTKPQNIDLYAAITREEENMGYEFRTVLIPTVAYPGIRSVAPNRNQILRHAQLFDSLTKTQSTRNATNKKIQQITA